MKCLKYLPCIYMYIYIERERDMEYIDIDTDIQIETSLRHYIKINRYGTETYCNKWCRSYCIRAIKLKIKVADKSNQITIE